MSACPSCGAQAPDDAKFCANCGAQLTEASTQDTPEATSPEPEAPEARSPVADDAALATTSAEEPAPSPLARGERKGAGFGVLLLLVAIAGLVVGATVWALSFKDPCEGKFSSERFAYCLSVPQGWQASPARIGSAEVDQFAKPTGVGVVIVQSQPLDAAAEGEAAQLETYAQQLRDQSEEAGMEVGAANEATLDGHDALVWSATSTTAEGDDFEQVQLATTQNGNGWSISLTDSAGGIEATRPAFQDMLQTWRFA